MIKVCLATVIAQKPFTFEEFTNIAKEVEAILNNHLLIYQDADSRDMPLTPSHLLRGRDILLFPPLHCPLEDLEDPPDTK